MFLRNPFTRMPVRVTALTVDALFNALLPESLLSALVAVRLGLAELASSELGGPIFPPELTIAAGAEKEFPE